MDEVTRELKVVSGAAALSDALTFFIFLPSKPLFIGHALVAGIRSRVYVELNDSGKDKVIITIEKFPRRRCRLFYLFSSRVGYWSGRNILECLIKVGERNRILEYQAC